MIDIEQLLDNAACASQERALLEAPVRDAIRKNCIEPLLKIIEQRDQRIWEYAIGKVSYR